MADDAQKRPQDAALEKAVGDILPLVQDGTISWDDLAQRLAPKPPPILPPANVPLPAKISKAVTEAIKRLPDVFGRVAPEEKRVLQPVEVTSLLEEREVIDSIGQTLEERKEGIRILVLNHFDAEIEEKFCCKIDADGLTCLQAKGHDGDCNFEYVPRQKEGHFIPRGEGEKWTHPGDGKVGKQFSWERRADTKATISPALLKALADDPDVDYIDHKDYLAMTEQVRQFSEHKAMLAVRKKPALIRALAEATTPGGTTASLFVRRVK